MAKKLTEKEKKKYSGKKSTGGPKRRNYLQRIARGGKTQRPRSGQYSKFGDIPEDQVHQGTATYHSHTFTDTPGTSRNTFSLAVSRGHSKNYFIFQNKLYKTTNSSGGHTEITI